MYPSWIITKEAGKTGAFSMNKSRLLSSVCPVLLACMSAGTAQAVSVSGQGTWETTLQARDMDGNLETAEAYYDTLLGITWLADPALMTANKFGLASDTALETYAGDLESPTPTQGYIDTNGDHEANWAGAMLWIDAMNADNDGEGYYGYTGWRLPEVTPVDGSESNWNTTNPDENNGTSDEGWAWTGVGWVDPSGEPVSELGHMFYVTLGNLGQCTPNDSDPQSCVTQEGYGLTNTAYFDNLDPDRYWTSVQLGDNNQVAMRFRFDTGNSNRADKDGVDTPNYYGAWAVHTGDIGTAIDITPVPLPAAIWLFGAGLLGLVGISRRKQTA
jgi:hypothetical protein